MEKVESVSVSLNHCPKCGGAADNGHDRSHPPTAYWCTKCMKTSELPIEEAYEIHLTNSDNVALVDRADCGLETYSWSLDSNGYPRRRSPQDWIYMHTDVIGTKEGFLPDHKNRNPLDNRSDNLRFVTRGQNVVNSSKADNPNATSQYKGVSLDRERNKWVASICHDGKKENLGRFTAEDEAVIAYNTAAIKYFGDAAFLNTVSNNGMVGGLGASTRKDEGESTSRDPSPATSYKISVVDEQMAEIVAKATEPNLWEHTHKADSDGYWKNNARKKKVLRRARIAVSALKPYFKREPEPISVINQALEKSAEILASFKGEPDSTKIEEWQACYARLFTQMNDLVQSSKQVSNEIGVISELHNIVSNVLQDTASDSNCDRIAACIMDRVKPYLRATKPVSVEVSLEKCAKAVRATSCIIGNDYCERLCESNPCACAINYSKAVLDAAEVPYVE